MDVLLGRKGRRLIWHITGAGPTRQRLGFVGKSKRNVTRQILSSTIDLDDFAEEAIQGGVRYVQDSGSQKFARLGTVSNE